MGLKESNIMQQLNNNKMKILVKLTLFFLCLHRRPNTLDFQKIYILLCYHLSTKRTSHMGLTGNGPKSRILGPSVEHHMRVA